MRRSGFTMVEILIVIAVIGLLAAIGAVASRGPLDRARVNNAVTTVQNVVSSARRQAKRTDVDIKVEVSSGSGRGKVVVGPDATFSTTAETTWLPSRVDVTNGATLVFAAPFGTYSGTPATIKLAGGKASATMIVAGILAQMVVKK